MKDYKVFETPIIECLPCQELASHSTAEKLDNGATQLEFYCPKAGRAFSVYYSEKSTIKKSFIEGVIRSALSLCSQCKELKQ